MKFSELKCTVEQWNINTLCGQNVGFRFIIFVQPMRNILCISWTNIIKSTHRTVHSVSRCYNFLLVNCAVCIVTTGFGGLTPYCRLKDPKNSVDFSE